MKKTTKYIPTPHPHVDDKNPPKVKHEDLECEQCKRTAKIPECSICSNESTKYCGNCTENFCDDCVYNEGEHTCMDCEYNEGHTCTECGTSTGGECGHCDEALCEDCTNTHMMDNHMDDVEDISEEDYICAGCDEKQEDCDCETVDEDDKDE